MKPRIIIILMAAFVTMLMTQYAFASPIVYVAENTSGFYKTGTMWDNTSTHDRGGHAYQYLVKSASSVNSTGKWFTQAGTHNPTYFWVWLPLNGGSLDASVKYQVTDVYGSSFYITVNQESYADQWVYLGYTNNVGSFVKLPNTCGVSSCGSNMQVWWDDMMEQYP